MQQYSVAASSFLFLLLTGNGWCRELVKIPASAKDITDSETGIQRTVSVGEFLISPTEVTQAEYESIAGSNPSFYKSPNRPVENISWWDAIRYCNLRSLKENLQPCYDLATGRCDRTRNGYRLPTGGEWESASLGVDPKQANLGTSSTKDTAALMKRIGTGTRDVASFAPSRYGLYDMLGNVWEWTDDANKTIRGGSFLSTVSGWARGYRSSMPPEHKGRYTGFRVVRTLSAAPRLATDASWFAPYNQPPKGFESSTGNLTPLGDVRALKAKWQKIVGAPMIKPLPPQVRQVETIHDPSYTGELMYLQTEPDSWERILVLRPKEPVRVPTPVVIVPYYDVDVPAGRNLGGRTFAPGAVRAYAQLAAQRGYIAIAIRWFGESYGERYDEAVANLKLRHPNTTGLGKWVWDAQRLLDYVYTLPDVDRDRIGIIGHSLGAKMALYAAALDDRIKAVVFSEGGIGFRMSNYEDFWYLGEAMRSLEPGTDQHELLALLAPRPFLLIGGDEYDKAESWHYINAARAVYKLHGKPENIGYFNHHSGHTPTLEAVTHGMRWLDHFLAP
ncbi:MAG TPA: SUMF1/EgtB/PvdO family nonheme iron enzyme [Bryobacteraceae bacterium]|nr:SUMF1/EgtB/PvdO family nonheme iron enzyme [Bryobacteraceae bacterium]